MIPVTLQPEPSDFNTKVRQKGHAWLKENDIPLDVSPQTASKLPTYWRDFNIQLWEAYSGICCYFAFRFEIVSGAATTDHFIAKSQNAGEAYEWSNYRLSTLGANNKKHTFDDVLDPVGLNEKTFFLNVTTGEVSVNKEFPLEYAKKAEDTINRLKLNDASMKRMRTDHFNEYLEHKCESLLRKRNPFVWYEALRQNLLSS